MDKKALDQVQDQRLRLALSFEEGSRDYAGIPWEFLYDSDQKTFLCSNNKIALSRLLASEHGRDSATELLGEPPDGQANVIASSEPLDSNLDVHRYAELQGQLLREEFAGYRELQYGPTELLEGRQGYMRRFEWTPSNGQPITQMQLYYVEKGRGFTATATTPSAHVQHVELVLRQVLGELRIEP
jgi:hypothetical protein